MAKPEVMDSKTKWCQTRCGRMYMFFNTDPKTGKLLGVDIDMAKNGVCANTQSKGHVHLINLCIDKGVKLEDMEFKLKDHLCQGHTDGVSCPDAIAKMVLGYIRDRGGDKD